MAAEHTPGPWELREVAHEATPFSPRRIYRMEVVAPQQYMGRRTHSRDICQIVDYCEWNDHPANARLIAAAPDLLEALEALVKANEQWNAAVAQVIETPPDWTDGYLDNARAAIRKARGTTNGT